MLLQALMFFNTHAAVRADRLSGAPGRMHTFKHTRCCGVSRVRDLAARAFKHDVG